MVKGLALPLGQCWPGALPQQVRCFHGFDLDGHFSVAYSVRNARILFLDGSISGFQFLLS
jgi:hypothetical protein